MFCCPLGAEASQQENILPATPSGTQQSNPMCALSNPSLMSSAPNILQPLTLNSSNGLLETIFPVDHTLSPYSPLAPSAQENSSGDPANCQRRLAIQTRPFSELYSEEVVPLDSDITSPEISDNCQEVNSENVINGNVTANVNNVLDMRTSTSVSNSVDTEPSGEATDQLAGSDNVHLSDGSGGETSASAQECCENNQDLETQPMDILEETDNVNDSALSTQIPVINGAISVGQRASIGSIGSIELTEDSPLRILEESERVREEEIALSSENLLQDGELEQMDVTDDTTVAGEDSSLNNTDCSMEDVLNSGTGMEDSAYDNGSIGTQLVAYQATELLDVASGSLVDEDEDDLLLSSLEEHEGSRSSPPVAECLPGPSVAAVVLESQTQAEVVTASEGSVESQSDHSGHEYSTRNPQLTTETSAQQRVSEQDVSMSLLEFVNHIVGNDNTEQSNDNEMIIESSEGTTQGASSTASSVRTSEATLVDSSLETGGAISSVTLPMEATEPVCLNAASLQSPSTSEMLVDSPDIVTVDNRMTDDGPATQQRPSRGKRLSRSSSDPRSTHSRRRGERLQNDDGSANQGESSPRLSRPPFVRRITEPVTGQTNLMYPVTVTVNSGNDVSVSSSQDTEAANTMVATTAVTALVSPTESVVMAVPLSPSPQLTTASGLTAVVVADGIAEPEALVTPLPSPEFSSEQGTPTLDTLSTAVAVSLSSGVNTSAENESPRTTDVSNDYELIIPDEDRQPSSAPSTLQRDAIPANATVLTNRTRLRSLSQDSRSSVIYATPVSGRSGELAERYNGSSSFPRQSSTARVTPLSGPRRRNSSSDGSSSTQTRAVPEQPQPLPQGDNHAVSASTLSAALPRRASSQGTEQSRTERVNNNSTLGATSLPGPSTRSNSDLNQSHQAIQTLLRSFCVNSTQGLPGPFTAGQPTSSTPVKETEPGRRASVTNPRSGNRRSSGQRQQGHPVYVSIQDQQQTREQQAQPEQQTAEEEPLPSSKKCEVCHFICCTFTH